MDRSRPPVVVTFILSHLGEKAGFKDENIGWAGEKRGRGRVTKRGSYRQINLSRWERTAQNADADGRSTRMELP